jgi:hypothetical protein
MTAVAQVFIVADFGNALALEAKPKTGFAQVNNVEINGHRTGRGLTGQFVQVGGGGHGIR